MPGDTGEKDTLTARRALEALRNGVPNDDAVKDLGCHQPEAERQFQAMLNQVAGGDPPPSAALGMLVSGEFGNGKSHLVTHLEQQALSRGFVCSKVTISKETPLYDLGKVFKSAVDHGRVPDRAGPMMEELAHDLNPRSHEYEYFRRWADDTEFNGLSPMFPASLQVHEQSNDLELNSEIEHFWAGDRIRVSRIKDGLRQIGQLQDYPFRAPKLADLPPQRLRFVVQLIRAAGYTGWVVFLDEIELVGSYSIIMRGRSYAELSRWCGQVQGDCYPGLVTVGTVTEDFYSAIIREDGADRRKRDSVNLLPKLKEGYKGPLQAPHGIRQEWHGPAERGEMHAPGSTERPTGPGDDGEAAPDLLRRLRMAGARTADRQPGRGISETDALQGPRRHQPMGPVATLSRLPPGDGRPGIPPHV